MKKQYRLVEVRQEGGVPYWVIQDRKGIFFRWLIERNHIFDDYDEAVAKLRDLRGRQNKIITKVIDV